MKKRWMALTLAFLAMAVGCSSGVRSPSDETAPEEAAVRVSVANPQVRTIAEEVMLAGTLAPYEQVTLYSRVDGYLKSIHCDIGDFVFKGRTLAEIDVPEVTASLEAKRAEVASAEAALGQAAAAVHQFEAEEKFERLNHERLTAIRKRNQDVLPQQEVDRAQAAVGVAAGKLEKARADVRAAEAAIRAAAAVLQAAERMAEYAELLAPISGVVTERFVDPGDLVQAAASSRTQVAPIVSVARLDRLRLLVDAPEPQAPFIRRGTRVRIRVSGLEPIEASVTRTSEVLNPATRTLRAEIHLDNPGRKLRPGMTAKVIVTLQTIKNALTVPVAAVLSQGNTYQVFVVPGDQAEQRAVRTGIESADWVQITDGLTTADAIVTASARPLRDGTSVVRIEDSGNHE